MKCFHSCHLGKAGKSSICREETGGWEISNLPKSLQSRSDIESGVDKNSEPQSVASFLPPARQQWGLAHAIPTCSKDRIHTSNSTQSLFLVSYIVGFIRLRKRNISRSHTFSTSSLSMGISQPSLTVPWTRVRHLCSRSLSESRDSYLTHSGNAITDWVAVSKPTGCSSQQTKENDWTLLVWKELLEANRKGREVANGSQPWRERTETSIITTRPG